MTASDSGSNDLKANYLLINIICKADAKENEKDRKISLDKSKTMWYPIQAPRETTQYRGVEQLAARRAHNPEVGGSSPSSATIKTPNFERNSVFF